MAYYSNFEWPTETQQPIRFDLSFFTATKRMVDHYCRDSSSWGWSILFLGNWSGMELVYDHLHRDTRTHTLRGSWDPFPSSRPPSISAVASVCGVRRKVGVMIAVTQTKTIKRSVSSAPPATSLRLPTKTRTAAPVRTPQSHTSFEEMIISDSSSCKKFLVVCLASMEHWNPKLACYWMFLFVLQNCNDGKTFFQFIRWIVGYSLSDHRWHIQKLNPRTFWDFKKVILQDVRLIK